MSEENLAWFMATEKSDFEDLVPHLSEDERITLNNVLNGAEEISDVTAATRIAEQVLLIVSNAAQQVDVTLGGGDWESTKQRTEPPSRQKEFSRNQRAMFASKVRMLQEALERLAEESEQKQHPMKNKEENK
jgi:hypothetical protein